MIDALERSPQSSGMSKLPPEIKAYRDFIAARFLRGSGIEIGAGPSPLVIDRERARVRYVDYMAVEALAGVYANIPADFVRPDVVDDGAVLSTFADASLDFVASCHMLEHTEDPIGVVRTHLRKLRRDGIVYIAIPDKRYCFDRDRPVTPIAHFIEDHEAGPDWSRDDHFEEFARLSQKTPPEKLAAQIASLKARDYRIHFHTWVTESFVEFLQMVAERYHPFEIEHVGRNHTELIAVLRVREQKRAE